MHSAQTLAFILGVAVAASVSADQSSCLERTIPVSIFSKDGSVAPEITPERLAAKYKRQLLGVKRVEIEKASPRVILLIDTSGSMQFYANSTIDIAEQVLSRLPAGVEAGLAFFSIDTTPIMLPGTDRSKILTQLEALRQHPVSFRGRTGLWSAIVKTMKMFGMPKLGDVIFLISDGGDNASKATQRDVAEMLVSARVRLDAVILNSHLLLRPRAPEEIDGPGNLAAIITQTGGTLAQTTDLELVDRKGKPTELTAEIDLQDRLIVNFYRVELVLPKALVKSAGLTLELAGLGKSEKDNLALAYPTVLSPCH